MTNALVLIDLKNSDSSEQKGGSADLKSETRRFRVSPTLVVTSFGKPFIKLFLQITAESSATFCSISLHIFHDRKISVG